MGEFLTFLFELFLIILYVEDIYQNDQNAMSACLLELC